VVLVEVPLHRALLWVQHFGLCPETQAPAVGGLQAPNQHVVNLWCRRIGGPPTGVYESYLLAPLISRRISRDCLPCGNQLQTSKRGSPLVCAHT